MTETTLNEIISKGKDWLKEEPATLVKIEINNLIRQCRAELLQNLLTSLGYDNIEHTTICIDSFYVVSPISSIQCPKHIVKWKDNAKVSWLDRGYAEPILDKFYLEITFPTGPYCLCGGRDLYAKALPFFDDMWKKIVSYKPDSLDTTNRVAYFEIHRPEAVELWNTIDCLVSETKKKFIDDLQEDKEERIRLLEEQLKKLKEEV